MWIFKGFFKSYSFRAYLGDTNMREDIVNLKCSVIILARRLLRLETSEKWRGLIKEIINDFGKEITEIDKEGKL